MADLKALFGKRDFDGLEKACNEELELRPGDRNALLYLAIAMYSKGDAEKLETHGERLYNDTKNPAYLILTAIAAYSKGEKDRAESMLEKMMAEDTKVGSALLSFVISSDFWDIDEGRKALIKSFKRDKKRTVAFLTDMMADDTGKPEMNAMMAKLIIAMSKFF